MTDNHLHNGQPHDDEHAALVSAFALGQLAGEEERAIAAQVARSPELQREVHEIRRIAGQLTEGLQADSLPAPSKSLADKLADQLDFADSMQVALPPPQPRKRWLEVMIGLVVCGGLAIIAVPAFLRLGQQHASTLTATDDSSSMTAGHRSNRASRWSQDGDELAEGVYLDSLQTAQQGRESLRTHSLIEDQSQAQGAGQAAAPGTWYHTDDVQYHAPGPEFKLQKPRSASGTTANASAPKGAMFGIGVNSDAGVTGTATGTKNPSAQQLMQPGPGVGGPGPGVLQPPNVRLYNGQQVIESESRYAEIQGEGKYDYVKGEGEVAGGLASADRAKAVDSFGREYQPDPVSNEQYDQIIENVFQTAKSAPLSTFSIDVDTAAYANTRRFLTGGQLPPPSAVRIEELINYFSYDDPQPQGSAPFSANMEIAECPWTPGHHLLRIGLKGKEMKQNDRPHSNLVFLLDVSGSMAADNKLPLVKQSMQMLVRELRENDSVTIVTYAGSEGLALDSTPGDQKEKINQAIETLGAGGSTQGSAGIVLAYEKAKEHFIKDGCNRVILCTDGDFNVGITSDEALVELITAKAKSGVFLSVLGFGMGNLKDSKMEKLADKGNGNYAYIDTLREGRKVLVEEMASSLVTIAKDVKIQIEFNPAMIASYRQIGYENRVLAAKDFADDTKDAGEIGAGHSVTALYEVVLVGNEQKATPPAESEIPLKYQKPTVKAETPADKPATGLELTDEASSGELLTLKLRFKAPDGDKSELVEFPLKQQPKKFGAASENLRFASAVAAFGMILRGSEYRGGATMSAVEEIAAAALGKDPSGYRTEFLDLARKASQLKGN